jgi:hypothetical protein
MAIGRWGDGATPAPPDFGIEGTAASEGAPAAEDARPRSAPLHPISPSAGAFAEEATSHNGGES